MTRLVVGLGNPGPEYESTRHNVGFRVVELLARREGLLFRTASALDGYPGRRNFQWARSHDPDALLVKPTTFMNRSGEAVAPLLDWIGRTGEEASNLIVVYDDLDLPPAALRIRPHGGAGGQNGMRSIIDSLGTDRYPRLRVGIGRPRTDAARHVLERFTPQEEEDIAISVAEAADALFFWLRTGDIDQCMARFHSRWTQSST
jgi:PTH1 family peptidyl-tRNA hydrolase